MTGYQASSEWTVGQLELGAVPLRITPRRPAALPTELQSAEPGACRQNRLLKGCFDVEGHNVGFWHQLRTEPPLHARWWQEWQRRVSGLEFFHYQQAGRQGSFLGVGSHDLELGTAVARELILGGWFWTQLRRGHHLIIVRANELEVFAGQRAKANATLSRRATATVLPLAREALEREVASSRRRRVAAGSLPNTSGWLEPAWRQRWTNADALAVARFGSHRLVVAGAMEQGEAEALAEELAQNGLWQPCRHGHAAVHCGKAEIQVRNQFGDSGAAMEMRDFASGFCEIVVVSDLHMATPEHDSFGHAKAAAFRQLLRQVIHRRSRLVINGDLLELAHERYGAIRRAYSETFQLLPKVRRIIYIAGNHDAAVLHDHIEQARRAVRTRAVDNTFAELRLTLDGASRLEPHGPQAGLCRLERAWQQWLSDPRICEALKEILGNRNGRIFLSRGFPEEGVAFKRLGQRDSPAEHPQWYFDESLCDRADATRFFIKLMADRRQLLDRVIQADWGGHVEIARHFEEPVRGLHFEHGHAAIPACSDGGIGRWISAAAGWLKRCGLRQIEHWIEEDLGHRLRAAYPFDSILELRLLTERMVSVGTALRALHPQCPAPLLVCGHTHEAVQAGQGPVDAFVRDACGGRYANSGAWSSRFRLRRPASDRGEWLTIAANNVVTVHASAPVVPDAGV